MVNIIWDSIETELSKMLDTKLSVLVKKEKVLNDDYPEKLSRKQAAKILNLDSLQTLDNWVKQGRVKKHGTGKKIYFVKSELMESKNFNQKYSRLPL